MIVSDVQSQAPVDSANQQLELSSAGFDPALGRTVSYMRKLPRANPAGSKWVYNTGEANLIGELVSQATGKSLAAYLSEKIWVPVGMELDATWAVGPDGR